MRFYEITETVQHDSALWATARKILSPLARQVSREAGPLLDRYESGSVVGTIGQLYPQAPEEIHDVILQFAPGEMSEYFAANSTSSRTDLLANYDSQKRYILLGGTDMLYDPEDVKAIITTLAHEMRHALDDRLSQGKFKGSHGRGKTQFKGSSQITDQPRHELRPLEINAHYTQALADIARRLKTTTATGQLNMIIRDAFKTYHVGDRYGYDLNDPNYRRLVQRAVEYAQSVIADKVSSREAPAQNFSATK